MKWKWNLSNSIGGQKNDKLAIIYIAQKYFQKNEKDHR